MTEITIHQRIISRIIEDLQSGTSKAMVANEDVINEFLIAIQKVMPKAQKVNCGIRTYIIDFDNKEMINRVQDELWREISHHIDMVSSRVCAIKNIRKNQQ